MYNSLKEKIREEGKERQAFRESLAQTLVNAHMAGRQAAADCEPTPMVVGNDDEYYFVDDGACGFAWVNVSPRNCRTANALKKIGLDEVPRYQWSSVAHEKAVQLWIHDYGQSVERKAAYASAYSEVLAAWAAENDEKAKIWSGSRLD